MSKVQTGIDALAEAMASGAPSLRQAALLIGASPSTAERWWKRIRDQLGEQAR